MPNFMTSFVERLLDLLFPDRCAGCKRGGGLLCGRCRAALRAYPDADPATEGLDGATVAWLYEGPLRPAIHRFKYERDRRVAVPLGDGLAARLMTHPQPADALLPVPLHPDRLAERGFNQAEELARRVSASCRLPLLTRGLERRRDTGHQAGLGYQDRQTNIAGAFVWRMGAPPPARVLLIDDVLTTGATLAACAAALRAAGCREVRAAAVARSLASHVAGRGNK